MISVIIPSYNRWKYLQRSINSVLKQTYTDWECIIINDCSTDNSYYTNSFLDLRIKIIHLQTNMRKLHNSPHAQGLTRNEGIKIAKGEYLSFLDDDDWWEPEKLEKQLDHMKKHNIEFCSTNAWFHQRNTKRIYFGELKPIFTLQDILQTNLIMNSSVLIKKSLVESVGYFNLIIYEDYDLWKRVMKYTDCLYISEPLLNYDGDHGDGVYYYNNN